MNYKLLTESRDHSQCMLLATEETTLIAFPHHVEKIQIAVVNVACFAIMTDVITEVEPRVPQHAKNQQRH